MASLRRVLSLLGCSLSLLPGVGCTRSYLQNEGPYTLTPLTVLRDDCELSTSAESLWNAKLEISGQVVRMDLGLMNTQLIGRFLDGGASDNDAFALDGSVSNAAAPVRGRSCLLNQVAMHLEATTQCATRFDGVLRVRFEPQPEDSACACQLWVTYRAVQKDSSCTTLP